jgi:hypothetical protein
LTSAPLPADAAAVRLVHAIDVELADRNLAWDAGVVEFLWPDGISRPADPLQGYVEGVASSARTVLHGRGAFAGQDPLTPTGPLRWRVDMFPVPNVSGPVRLRLRFGSDPVNLPDDPSALFRGWIVAKLESLTELPGSSAFPVALLSEEGESLVAWDWFGEPVTGFSLEVSLDQGLTWREIFAGLPATGAGGFPWAVPLAALAQEFSPDEATRNLVRVVAFAPFGPVASRPLVVYRDGGLQPALLLGPPYPNPAVTEVRLLLSLPAGSPGELNLFDIRGRRLRQWQLTGGKQLLVWDGLDGQGRRAAAGLYIFRLDATGRSASQKVVFLP